MNLQDSFDADERILAEAPVYDDPHALFFSGKSGTIACTESQIVFEDSKNTLNISTDNVSSIEFQEPKWSRAYLYSSIASIIYGIFGGGLNSGLTILAFVVGVVLLATGYWQRTSKLTIHIPGRTYHFKSRGSSLGEIVRSCRVGNITEK
ncbi:hypothetical protein [Haloprofundus salilacus]|uniref:hypothetical protein n=1 Tax=Haloprofundus salilacus TaxID=2876190 RepID=UPI001CCABB45|nr:hypothetical protein [Haloprofundus salilacus]